MIKNRQTSPSVVKRTLRSTDTISKISFDNPRLKRVGVDVLTLHELRQRAAATLIAPQRVDFYFLMLIQAGHCKHTVDFIDYKLKPGSVVFLRPGQIQQWHMHEQMQGLVLLVAAEAMIPSVTKSNQEIELLFLDQWPAVSVISMGLFLQAYADALRLREEVQGFAGADREAAIIWHTMLAMLLRLARQLRLGDLPTEAMREATIYRLFSQMLEMNFQQRLSVLDYANKLGYSQSTLARACLAVTQQTPKTLMDQRLSLEAKRLLVHSRLGTAAIASKLGFTEPTNFIKFFKRETGLTPSDFRGSMG